MTSNQIVDLITKALTIIMVPAVTLLATMLANYLRQRTKSLKTKALIQQATEVVCNVVAEVNQTFVDQLKQDGAFDKANAEKAAKKALELAKAQLGKEGLKLLDQVMADGSAYLKSLIEYEVRTQKGE